MSRPDRPPAEELAMLADELLDQVVTETRYDWRPEKARRVEHRKHVTREPGLLTQLATAAGVRDRPVARPTVEQLRHAGQHTKPDEQGVRRFTLRAWTARSGRQLEEAAHTGMIRYDEGGHGRPGSRPPGQATFGDVLADVEGAVLALHARMTAAAHRPARRVPVERAVRDVVGLATCVDADLAEKARRTVRALAAACRVALSYQAPAVELTGTWCGTCGGALKVRSDLTSDVWCSGGDRVWPPWSTAGCGERWSRFTWIQLLEETERGTGRAADG